MKMLRFQYERKRKTKTEKNGTKRL